MRELREHAEPALRILCCILAAVLVYELAGMIIRWNPFRGATVPDLPALTAATNNPPGGVHGTNLAAAAAIKGTNGAPPPSSTNSAQSVAAGKTNSISPPAPAENKTKNATNLVAHVEPTTMETNLAVISTTNMAANTSTNVATRVMTNSLANMEAKSGGTNSATVMISTNNGTNVLLSATANGTNASKPKKKKAGAGPMPDMGFNPFGAPGMPGKPVDLPPAVQARISRITDSEILGPVMRPLPMALLGIAGEVAFLRSDSGQTGLVKEGDTLDDLKLLRIGINRVLIEQKGQKKELTMFSGYGSDTLLQNDSTNENKHL